ncbi:hypothetical protein LMG33818_000064 [Halomonadaceae bacterium LMG 33818]|uniref:baseplate J/gp47 family protein n=1 Tax=Cernens ardua TaxID=3402176 RepID=UPI003EDC9998
MAFSETDKQYLSDFYQNDEVTASTSVPAMTFSEQGITAPDIADILQGVLNDWKQALGGNASTDLTTPQGQIALAMTAIISDKNDQLLALSNNLNPDNASGIWQDGIGQIYFINRKEATGTSVTGTCTGLVGTVIPAGSYAQDTTGFVYRSDADATIPSTGSVDVVFTNMSYGPIECPAGTLTTIYSAVDGWSGVNNAASGVIGQNEESRTNFEQRRRSQVAKNAKGTPDSIYGALLDIDGVSDAYVRSNNTAAELDVGSTNVIIPTGTIYIAIYGGNDTDIANAINSKINPGCATRCNTANERSATIEDTQNYSSNIPSYTFYWTTPATIDVYFKITIQRNEFLPNNLKSLIQSSVEDSFTGEDGGTRARIGSTIYASRFYGGVQNIDQNNVNILSIQVSRDGQNYSDFVDFGVDEIPVFNSDNVDLIEASSS